MAKETMSVEQAVQLVFDRINNIEAKQAAIASSCRFILHYLAVSSEDNNEFRKSIENFVNGCIVDLQDKSISPEEKNYIDKFSSQFSEIMSMSQMPQNDRPNLRLVERTED